MDLRQLFLQHVAQTSDAPLAIDIVKAEGCKLWDSKGNVYLDLIGGISVANTGHRHPRVVEAIKKQLDSYLHVMVYGEFVQNPQVEYANVLSGHLPDSLNSVYFTNSGAEAVEGAMKLAKRVTGRTEIIAFDNAYHGSTQGALSIIGSEYWRNNFRPLLPGITHARYNSEDSINLITSQTACVIAETVQGEAGIVHPDPNWIKELENKCKANGSLLILDEIQAGFGRTGKLWGFEHYNVIPDILLLGKALGGGLPLGAFIADQKLMWQLTTNPVLGHITTFGGHPLSCSAGLAAFKVLLEEGLIETVKKKESLFKSLLKHELIKSISSFGLWMAVEFSSFEICKQVIDGCIQRGLLTDWFLFASASLRISPPLTITEEEVQTAASIIIDVMNSISVQ